MKSVITGKSYKITPVAWIHVLTESDSPECIIVKSVITGKSYKTTPVARIHVLTESDSPECIIVKSVITGKSYKTTLGGWQRVTHLSASLWNLL